MLQCRPITHYTLADFWKLLLYRITSYIDAGLEVVLCWQPFPWLNRKLPVRCGLTPQLIALYDVFKNLYE